MDMVSKKDERGIKHMDNFTNYVWALVVSIFFPSLAAITLANAIATSNDIDYGTYAITILRMLLGLVFIGISTLFVIKKSNI